MKLALQDIASVQTGVFAKPGGQGEVIYLQVRHFNEHGRLSEELYPNLGINDISPKHLLQPGDVLFAAKGFKNFAVIYEQHNQPAVASTSFMVMRLKQKNILPGYLAWFLNHPSIIEKLKNEALGTSLPSVSKHMMEDLEISVPSIRKQELVLQISQLQERQRQLLFRIKNLQETAIQQQLIQAINS